MMRRTHMKRGAPLRSKAAAPKRRDPSKVPAHGRKPSDRRDQKALDACRGEDCYLALPWVCRRIPRDATVVPAHENQGKGMGLKACDRRSVPACFLCHTEYDQGRLFTRDQKREMFNNAIALWEPRRKQKIGY